MITDQRIVGGDKRSSYIDDSHVGFQSSLKGTEYPNGEGTAHPDHVVTEISSGKDDGLETLVPPRGPGGDESGYIIPVQ